MARGDGKRGWIRASRPSGRRSHRLPDSESPSVCSCCLSPFEQGPLQSRSAPRRPLGTRRVLDKLGIPIEELASSLLPIQYSIAHPLSKSETPRPEGRGFPRITGKWVRRLRHLPNFGGLHIKITVRPLRLLLEGNSIRNTEQSLWPASSPRSCPGQFSKRRLQRRPQNWSKSRPRPCFRSSTSPRPAPKGHTCQISRSGSTDRGSFCL